jgi:hypothetical protein
MGIVAGIQAAPIYCDAMATARYAAERIAEAARAGAWLAVLPESYIPGYPEWIWRKAPRQSSPSVEPYNSFQRRFFEQTITVPGPETDVIAQACRTHSIMAAVGVTDRPARSSTLYNTAGVFRAGWRYCGAPPQARADLRRTFGLGSGRWNHAAHDRNRARDRWRPDLLGESHALGSHHALYAGRADSRRPDAG